MKEDWKKRKAARVFVSQVSANPEKWRNSLSQVRPF